jgi:hypothetical protein
MHYADQKASPLTGGLLTAPLPGRRPEAVARRERPTPALAWPTLLDGHAAQDRERPLPITTGPACGVRALPREAGDPHRVAPRGPSLPKCSGFRDEYGDGVAAKLSGDAGELGLHVAVPLTVTSLVNAESLSVTVHVVKSP